MSPSSSSTLFDPSSLIFPSAAYQPNPNTIITQLKRQTLTVHNRLRSIAHDATFVAAIAETYKLPLIANERCGSWYIPSSVEKAGSAYFKSTDGHFGQWSCSLRRLNLGVLDVIGDAGGCIVVDSTRRGKSIPDALSKTVPIWIAVLNRLLFPERADAHALQTPLEVVSRSEHAQIEERLEGFVESMKTLDLDLPNLRSKLRGTPMKPTWIVPGRSEDDDIEPVQDEFHLVVLCTASCQESPGFPDSAGYVQGAADDSESWAYGLTPNLFWQHESLLLSTSEDDLPALIETLTHRDEFEEGIRQPTLIKPTSSLFLTNNAALPLHQNDFDVIVSCTSTRADDDQPRSPRQMRMICRSGKLGSRDLRTQLLQLEELPKVSHVDSKLLIACETGRDLAVGVALAILCRYCDEQGHFDPQRTAIPEQVLNKSVIKHRLSWIMVSMPDAAPSRATLQSINAYLLG